MAFKVSSRLSILCHWLQGSDTFFPLEAVTQELVGVHGVPVHLWGIISPLCLSVGVAAASYLFLFWSALGKFCSKNLLRKTSILLLKKMSVQFKFHLTC